MSDRRAQGPLLSLAVAIALSGCDGCGGDSTATPSASASPSASAEVAEPWITPEGELTEAGYLQLLTRLYEELNKDINRARHRTYCSFDEYLVAEHRLTPNGFRRMQPIVSEIGAEPQAVERFVAAHPDFVLAQGELPQQHANAIKRLRNAVKERLEGDEGALCQSDPPRCDKAFLAVLEHLLAEVPEAEQEKKRIEYFGALPGFLHACDHGRDGGDFTCVLEASSAQQMDACVLSKGFRIEWMPSVAPAPPEPPGAASAP